MNTASLARLARGAGRRLRLVAAGALERRVGPPPRPADVEPEYRLLLVCRGNSCRSPLAEGILRARLSARGLLGRVRVDSAGTDAGDPGAPPDLRARIVARRHGIAIGDLRARPFAVEDFDRFDRVLVFDRDNLERVRSVARSDDDRGKVALLVEGDEVADPAPGELADFERAFVQLESVADGLVDAVQARLDHAS